VDVNGTEQLLIFEQTGVIMGNGKFKMLFPLFVVMLFLLPSVQVKAQTLPFIQNGVFAGSIDLSGMTEQEAADTITTYVDSLGEAKITLIAGGGHEVTTTPQALGIAWANPELVKEALMLGQTGNVVERYKARKDLEHANKVYDIRLSFRVSELNRILTQECASFDQKAINYALRRENDAFIVVDGQTGYKLDIETSIDTVYNYLTTRWDGKDCRIKLDVTEEEPLGSQEELAQITDILGSCTTSFTSSGADRSRNVTNGCALVNGHLLYPGEEFSTYDAVSPFTEENGYYMAGSYLNGRVVDSLGGGICQVSTTLYNAVLGAELEVTERHNHSMIVNYVEPSADAAIAESAGKDFRFVNNTPYPIYIEGVVLKKNVTFTIYGKETRDPNRQVTYQSEVLQTILPESEIIYQDLAQPIGYITEEAAHIGYKAKLWKVVTENGIQVSRTEVNSSNYKMVPKSATVGVATGDPLAYNEMAAAIGTGSIDHVKLVINILLTQAQAAAAAAQTNALQ
jgi:vancomycin resistance protein YoaR